MLNNIFNDNGPLFQQIVDYIQDQIVTGQLHEEERVPSVRELGETLGVNPNTCSKAYEILTADNIIETRRGTGSWILAGAKEKIYTKMRKEFSDKTIPYIVQSMKKCNINKEELLKLISQIY